MLASFYAGGVAGWFLHTAIKPLAPRGESAPGAVVDTRDGPREAEPVATSGAEAAGARGAAPAELAAAAPAPIVELRRRPLQLPIDGADVDAMEGSFHQRRGGGARGHEAVDILAPRDTPVRAIDEGTIAKLFVSKAGGITVYQLDPTGRFCYYYAHLERYAAGLREGQRVSRGDVIGHVGTTGNAPPNTPHLHFAVFELTGKKRWWEGRPLDPYLIFDNRADG
jgi:murein DD-endopeptidase MepM/ murein hydrolase activator NlpD